MSERGFTPEEAIEWDPRPIWIAQCVDHGDLTNGPVSEKLADMRADSHSKIVGCDVLVWAPSLRQVSQ